MIPDLQHGIKHDPLNTNMLTNFQKDIADACHKVGAFHNSLIYKTSLCPKKLKGVPTASSLLDHMHVYSVGCNNFHLPPTQRFNSGFCTIYINLQGDCPRPRWIEKVVLSTYLTKRTAKAYTMQWSYANERYLQTEGMKCILYSPHCFNSKFSGTIHL